MSRDGTEPRPGPAPLQGSDGDQGGSRGKGEEGCQDDERDVRMMEGRKRHFTMPQTDGGGNPSTSRNCGEEGKQVRLRGWLSKSKSREDGQSAKQDTTGRGLEGNENCRCKSVSLTRKIHCSAARGGGGSPRVGCLSSNGVCWKVHRMERPTPRVPGCAQPSQTGPEIWGAASVTSSLKTCWNDSSKLWEGAEATRRGGAREKWGRK